MQLHMGWGSSAEKPSGLDRLDDAWHFISSVMNEEGIPTVGLLTSVRETVLGSKAVQQSQPALVCAPDVQ